jgi:hypothetical protein
MAPKMPTSDAEDLIDGDLGGAEQRQRGPPDFSDSVGPE